MNNSPTVIRVSGPDTIADYQYTKTCLYCGDDIIFNMTQDQYKKWKIDLNYIQHVFPHLDSSIREAMISGTHPTCWDEIFTDSDEEDYSDINEIVSNWKH